MRPVAVKTCITKMMRAVRPTLTHLAVAAGALLGPKLYACECAQAKLGDALKLASVVLRGTVVRIDHLNPIQPPQTGDDKQKVALVAIPRSADDQTLVTFKVTASWKEPVTESVKLFAVARPSMCDGYQFHLNTEYVVYASKNLNQNWEDLKLFSQGAFVYDIAECPLRVRTDVRAEVRRLGRLSQRFPQ